MAGPQTQNPNQIQLPDECCANCRLGVVVNVAPHAGSEAGPRVLCRRNPPAVSAADPARGVPYNIHHARPLMAIQDWCSKWKAQPARPQIQQPPAKPRPEPEPAVADPINPTDSTGPTDPDAP